MTKEEFKNYNYTCEEPNLLYIDRYGRVFPDCKTYMSPVICKIDDPAAVEKVKHYIFKPEDTLQLFNMVTIEVSSACHAKCFYCFQEDGHRNEPYIYYDYLLPFLKQLNIKWLFFSGGEILDQPDAMDFMYKCRESLPDTWIHLKTNGNASLDKVGFINDCCDSVMISFNGFSDATCRTIMGIDINKTIAFCEAIKVAGKCNLGVKFLASPVTLVEVPMFLNWAIKTECQCIAVQTVYNYSFENGKCNREKSTFADLPKEYWELIYSRVGETIVKAIQSNAEKINNNGNFLTSDKKFLALFDFPENVRSSFRTDGVYVIE